MAEPALHEQLKQHFARRVTRQVISVIELYRQCADSGWKEQELSSQLLDESEKLTQLASRFEMKEVESAGYQITSILKLSGSSPSESQTVLKGLNNALEMLLKHQGDATIDHPVTTGEKSVTIALNNSALAEELESVFSEHGFSITCANPSTSHEQLIDNQFLLIDIDFPSAGKGFQLANGLKKNDQRTHHLMFINFSEDNTERRLKAIRAGGQAFIHKPGSARQILDEVFDIHTQHKNNTPRILVVDDSLSQAKFTENILLKQSLDCHILVNPMELCSELTSYRPDLILMDMYMPECDGIELASVVRQHHDFNNTPIIFLSAEDDGLVQDKAASFYRAQFMSKPPKADILVETIHQALKQIS